MPQQTENTPPEYTAHAHYCNFDISGDQKDIEWPEKLPEYSSEHQNDIYRPEVMKSIEGAIDSLNPELRKLSLEIHSHPELGYEEKHAHDTLTAFMSKHGFKVTEHYLGIETAWRAEFSHGEGGRTIGFNSEMDALPGIGHACGHNLIAIAGVGAAIGVKAALEQHNISGKVVLLGTPAEEILSGKIVMIEKGGYKDMDACIMCHPGPGAPKYVGTGPSLAVQELNVEFFGHTSHASAAPWEAINALDAAFLSYTNISVLRQQIKPDHRVHGVVEGRNWAANIIPDYSRMRYFVRAPSWAEVKVLRERVIACFDAAALASGCKHEVKLGSFGYDIRQNEAMKNEFASIIGNRYGFSRNNAPGAIGGSTDFGNVTYELPSIHPSFAIPTKPNGGNHTALFTEAAATQPAHDACIAVTKALSLTGFRIVDDDKFFAQAQATFKGKQA